MSDQPAAVGPVAGETVFADAAREWRDTAGVETLRRMASVERYNDWIFRKLACHVGTRVVEVGCGIGNMTPYFLGAEAVTCIDVLPESVAAVRQEFAAHPHVRAELADIADPGCVARLGAGGFDTAVCVNVLEHVERDSAALRHMHDLLAPGGKMLLFVPAGQYLYGQTDFALGHFRRYAREPLRALVEAQGFEVVELFYMNVAGIPGWFLASRVLKREMPPHGLLWLFNLLTPLFATAEEILRPPFGQSLVCVARRPRPPSRDSRAGS